MLDVCQCLSGIIKGVTTGEFNNSIVPVLISSFDMPKTPSRHLFPLSFQLPKSKEPEVVHYKSVDASRLDELRRRCPRDPINYVEDCVSLQNDLSLMYERIDNVKHLPYKVLHLRKSLRQLTKEKEKMKRMYDDLFISKTQRLPAVKSELTERVLKSYASMQNFRIPVLPKVKINFETKRGMDTLTDRLLPPVTPNRAFTDRLLPTNRAYIDGILPTNRAQTDRLVQPVHTNRTYTDRLLPSVPTNRTCPK